MTYHTTKIVKTLEKYVKKDHPEECKNKDVTHVVSSVTYGLNAVFNFKRVIQDHEKEEHVKGCILKIKDIFPIFIYLIFLPHVLKVLSIFLYH